MSPRVRRIAIGIAVAAAVVVVLLGASLAVLFSPMGKRGVERFIEHAASGPGRQVALDGFRLTWPFSIGVDRLTVADADGVWLEVNDLTLAGHPLRALDGVIDIDRLTAQRIHLIRVPEGQPKPQAQPSQFRLPGNVSIAELRLPVVAEPAVIGERLGLLVAGSARIGAEGGVNLTARADDDSVVRISGSAGRDYLDLRWYVDMPRTQRWQRLAGIDLAGRISGNGFIAGRMPQPSLGGEFRHGGGQVASVAWKGATLSFRANSTEQKWSVTLVSSLAAPGQVGSAPLAKELSLELLGEIDAASGRVLLSHVWAQIPGARMAARGILNNWGERVFLTASIDVPKLEDLGGLFVSPMRGGVHGRVNLEGNLAASRLTGNLVVQASPTPGDPTLDRVVGQPRLDATLSLAPENRLRIMTSRLEIKAGSVWARGSVLPRLGVWAGALVPRGDDLDPRITGSLAADARVYGPLSSPRAWMSVEGRQLAVSGVSVDGSVDFLGGLNGQDKPGLAGQVGADLRLKGRPVKAKAQVATQPSLRIDDLQVSSGQSTLRGDLALDHGNVRGRLNADVPRIEQWQDLLPTGVKGALAMDVSLDPARGQSAQASITGKGLAVGGGQVSDLRLDAQLSRLKTDPMVALRLEGQGLQMGEVAFANATVIAEGTQKALRFTLDGKGTQDEPARLAGAGTLSAERGGGNVRLDRLALNAAGHRIALADPTKVTWRGDRLVLSPTQLAMDGGRVMASGEQRGQIVDASIRLQDVPLQLAELFVPALAPKGSASGTIGVSGRMDNPRVRLALTGRDIAFAQTGEAGFQAMAAKLNAELADRRVKVQAEAHAGTAWDAMADLQFPFALERAGQAGRGSLSGHVRVAGEIGQLAALMPSGSILSGRVNADVLLAGTVAQPELRGTARIERGRYENLDSGTIIANLAALIDFAGTSLTVEGGGTDGGGGTLTLSGGGRLLGGGSEYRTMARLNKFKAVRRDDIEATMSGEVDLEGGGSNARLAGKLAVDNAEVDLSRMAGKRPTTLDVVEINGSTPAQQGEAQEEEEEAAASPLNLALAVDVGIDRAFIRGKGLDSEWRGDVAVGGTMAEPSVTGKVSVVRGQYELVGHTFRFDPERGTITFLGGNTIDPALDIAAETKTQDITATLVVTGTAHDPSVDITSSPPLPKEEIFARVLFGSESAKLSVFQQLQLAQLAASGLNLFGGGGGFDPIGDIRGALGLDVLQVGQSDQTASTGADTTSSPTLSLGKYIGPNTFVRVDQGTTGLGKVTVEQEVGSGFSVSTSYGEQSGGGLGFNWRFDY